MKICLLCGDEVKHTPAGLRCNSCGIVPIGAVKETKVIAIVDNGPSLAMKIAELQPHEENNGTLHRGTSQ